MKHPKPPPEAQTEAEQIAYCAGWWDAMAHKEREMTLREAARLALEALEKSSVDTPYGNGFGLQRRADERAHEAAITALRAALEGEK